jgi:hypothetical protein
VQLATTVVFVALVAGLVFAGYRASLRITGGTDLEVTDPAAPGYVAEVKPTPVDLLVLTDGEDRLAAGVVVAAGPEGSGGVVLPVPKHVAVPGTANLGTPTPPEELRTVEDVFAAGGAEEVRNRLGEGLTFGFSSVTEVPLSTMEELARLAGPIDVTVADNLLELGADGEETLRYRAGQLTLQPEEVVPFLSFNGSNEIVPNQELRHDAVWRALLEGLADVDREQLEPIGRGLGAQGAPSVGELVADLLDDEVRFDTVPLEGVPVPGTLYRYYAPDPAALPAFVVRNVPSPTSGVPGQRARVRVLNGTTDRDALTPIVPKVVAAGGEVTMIGNAGSFDEATTRVEYSAPEARTAAEQIALALGVPAQRVRTQGPISVDVEVVVGGDRSS